ncbi:MAG: cytochrome P450 [Herpetosiphonaceae bacterium]|nr:cytochrome P450 [Herpetosiphonaceae bacterium]
MAIADRVPGPKGNRFKGQIQAFRENTLGFLLDCAHDYGDVVHFKTGPRDHFLLNHPDYIKDVLVTNNRNFTKSPFIQGKPLMGEGLITSEGEFHHRQRRLAQPAFHRKRIATYASIMTQYSKRHIERWQDGETRDIAEDMMQLALAIVSKALYDTDVEAETDSIGAAVDTVMLATQRSPAWLYRLAPSSVIKVLDQLPLPANQRFLQAKARLDTTIYRMIAEHRAHGGGDDLLSMLMRTTDEDQDGAQMSDAQLRDEAITIFLAGHETTANALTWAWYLLSTHPQVEAKVYAEIDEVLGGRVPTIDDIPKLTYIDMVVHESLRLYPPVWMMARTSINAFDVGGYRIPAKTSVMFGPYVMQRDPRYFPDPERFDPMRWTPEAQAERPKFSYFPFGGGPRQCIGEAFAWMELITVLATIAQHWRMRVVPGHVVEPQPRLTLRPRNGVMMKFEERVPVPHL